MAHGKDGVYIKGIFQEYPDSWIKGNIQGKKLMFENGQVLALENGRPIYFHRGSTSMDMSFGHTYSSYGITFDSDDPIPLEVSDDGKTMSVNLMQRGGDLNQGYSYYNGAFWYNKDEEGGDYCQKFVEYGYTPDGHYEEDTTPFPEKDFMINMCFKKTD